MLLNKYWLSSVIAFVMIAITTTCFYSCEKDDICVDPTTPLLVIRFYDATNQTSPLAVTQLRVMGQDQEIAYLLSNTDSIAIPLKTLEDSTTYTFTANYGVDEDDNEVGDPVDITFNYTREEVYVSTACGYKVNYSDLNATFTPFGGWINNIIIDNPEVTDQTNAHVYIYH